MMFTSFKIHSFLQEQPTLYFIYFSASLDEKIHLQV